jgi:hypothetical protein
VMVTNSMVLNLIYICYLGDEEKQSEATKEVLDAFDAQITGELEGHL